MSGWSGHVVRWAVALTIALVAAFVSAPVAVAQPADGGDVRARAKASFERGVEAYEAQRYAEALDAFQEAYRLKPHPLVRVNIANCYDKLGKPLLAIFHFERFLEEEAGSPEQRVEVQHALRALRAQIAELTLRVVPDGARVVIDGGDARRAPLLEPVRLEKGLHVVDVSLEGYLPVQRDIVLEGGQRMELEIALERAPVAAPVAQPRAPAPRPIIEPLPEEPSDAVLATPEPEPEPEPAPAPARDHPSPTRERPLVPTAAWISGGVTAALLVGALVTGQLALSAESEFEADRQTALDYESTSPLARRAAYADALDAADRADALALTSDALLVSSVVGAAVTVYLIVSADDDGASASLRPVLAGGRPGLRVAF